VIRLLSLLVTLVLCGGVYMAWTQFIAPLPVAQPAGAPSQVAGVRADTSPQPPRVWPALFGEVAVPEPQPPAPPPAPPPPAPTPPKPPSPPVESLGYNLTGIVRTEAGDWALVSHPTGDTILREGDELAPGLRVVSIGIEGVWLDDGDTRVLLPFVN